MVFISSVPTRCGLAYNDSWLSCAVSVTRPSLDRCPQPGYRRWGVPRRYGAVSRCRHAPIAQLAEAADLKSAQCRFESDWGHTIAAAGCGSGI